MIDELIPLCYGRLNMTTQQIEDSCICEINAYADGWLQRHCDIEDLFILYGALPTYQVKMGKKAPSYHDMTRGRKLLQSNSLDEEPLEYLKWLASEE